MELEPSVMKVSRDNLKDQFLFFIFYPPFKQTTIDKFCSISSIFSLIDVIKKEVLGVFDLIHILVKFLKVLLSFFEYFFDFYSFLVRL